MLRAHREDRNDFAESTSRDLLSNDDLPLLIRARACMVLACSNDSDYVDMAKEGARIGKLIYGIAQGPVEQRILDNTRTVLRQSLERSEKEAANEEIDDGDLKVVWQADDIKESGEGASQKQTEPKPKQTLAADEPTTVQGEQN